MVLQGNLDAATTRQVAGWARDLDKPGVPVSLIITVDGAIAGRVLANRYRVDLKEAGIGDGRHSFEFEFPKQLAPFEPHIIRVCLEIEGTDISGSPISLDEATCFEETEGFLSRALESYVSPKDTAHKLGFLADQMDKLRQGSADAESRRFDRAREQKTLRSPPLASVVANEQPNLSLRALIIDDRLPKPERDAGSNAILSHIASLQRLGYEVTMAPALDFAPQTLEAAALQAMGVACCSSPFYGSVEEVLRRQAGQFDLIYLHRISNASKYGELAAHYCPNACRIYSVADLHHLRLMHQGVVEDRPELVALSRRVRLAEFAAAAFSHVVITHSTTETDLIKAHVPSASVFTIPWSVKVQPTQLPFSVRHGFAFIGSFGHAPNLDAVRWLVNDIYPLVKARDPTIQCFLVGSDMPDAIRGLSRDGVVTIGQVDHLREIFDRVRLTVAPLTYGAGVKGKVIESLAAGVPCVCTPIAAEGFNFPDPLRACIATTATGIAETIVRLHKEETDNQQCGHAGLDFVAKTFSESEVDSLLKLAIPT